MSVPPLVCSTPPPPDHVDEIVYNDEFSLDYEEVSPAHQYDSRGYSFNDPPSVKETSPEVITTSPCTSPSEKLNAFQTNKNEPDVDGNIVKKEQCPGDIDKLSNETDIPQQQDDFKVDDISNHIIEDNGIEDLDLKLDSLQLDFQNTKESIEETLNSTFDDFGTFLSNNTPNDSLDNSIYLPIPGLTDSKSDKPQKIHDISSDGSFSPANGDNSDSEIGWENIPDLSNENTDIDNISTDVPDIFFDTSVVYPDADKDLTEHVTNELQDNINISDTCQTLTDSSISNNDEYTTDAHFEPISILSDTKKLSGSIRLSDDIINDTTPDTYDEKSINNSEAVTDKIPFENVNTHDYIEPALGVDFVSDAFSTFSIGSEIPVDIEPLNVVENQDNCDAIPDVFKTDIKSIVDDDFDDFAAFETDTELNLFPENINIEFASSLQESKTINSDSDKSVLKSDSIKDDVSQSDNDDFGDFDTYDPSCEPVQTDVSESAFVLPSKSSGSMHITEFGNSNDTEIYEKLCSVVNEIFPDENYESDSCKDCELNTALGESWKHLKDYETEQSYLFQWNNSASQKSLLKSLGIDSRNILFGPKWNTNMPRFAANLGVNPLQPIRQISNVNTMSDYRSDDRSTNEDDNSATITSDCKENDWENATTLSTADLQASIERGEEHTNIPHSCEHVTPPEQLAKSVKNPAHPTILNIGRQINLPETHIFTPTDSETPWSHTIHYNETDKTIDSKIDDNNTSHALKAQPLEGAEMDAFENFTDFQSHSNSFGTMNNSSGNADISQYDFDFVLNEKPQAIPPMVNSDSIQLPPFANSEGKEIDDFGDFHSAEALKQVSQVTPSVQPLHVLEPVKVISNVPVVNWPAPGDIKSSAFEEFTDIPAVPPLQPIWDNDKLEKPAKLFSSAPTFILKESKIISECFTADDVVKNSALKANTLSSEFDEFTDFQSVGETTGKLRVESSGPSFTTQPDIKESSPISSIDSNKNISFDLKNVNNAANDDFDDFQSVEFNSVPSVSNETPKYTYSLQSFPRQEFVPKYQNSYPLSTATRNSTPKPLGFPVDQYSRTPLQPISVQQTEDYAQKNASHQILQPLSLESYSQINWPDPGIDLQDLSRFNPINSIQSYTEPKEISVKNNNSHGNSQSVEDDGWSDFVSIKPASQNMTKTTTFNATSNNHSSIGNSSVEDNEDWSDFVSNTVLPSRNYNEVKTISQNIHSQANSAAPYKYKGGGGAGLNPSMPKPVEVPPSISVLPHLSYSTPKTSASRKYNNHFQNL